jgi:hypothetical protein
MRPWWLGIGLLVFGLLNGATAEAASAGGGASTGGRAIVLTRQGQLAIVAASPQAPAGSVAQAFAPITGVGATSLVRPGPVTVPSGSIAAPVSVAAQTTTPRPPCVEKTPRGVLIVRGLACEPVSR